MRTEQERELPAVRGGKAAKRGLSAVQAPLLVGRDLAGQTSDFVLKCADTRHVTHALAQSLAVDAISCADSGASAAWAVSVRACTLEHQAATA